MERWRYLNKMIFKKIDRSIELGKSYLISKIDNGLCFEFHQLRHGPSWAWTTACVGSSLSEFGFVSKDMLKILLSLQHKNGGWSYNQSVPADTDSTLRVIQFLRKIGYEGESVLDKAEKFVISHQLADGGFTTYLPEEAAVMGYDKHKGWCSSHPDVTALAINQISDVGITEKAKGYLLKRLKRGNLSSYWWRTPYYVLYEAGQQDGCPQEEDPIEIGLSLLLDSKNGIYNKELVLKLISMQHEDGSYPSSRQFRIPHPHQLLNTFDGNEEIVEDRQSIFSTCTATVALARQMALVKN